MAEVSDEFQRGWAEALRAARVHTETGNYFVKDQTDAMFVA